MAFTWAGDMGHQRSDSGARWWSAMAAMAGLASPLQMAMRCCQSLVSAACRLIALLGNWLTVRFRLAFRWAIDATTTIRLALALVRSVLIAYALGSTTWFFRLLARIHAQGMGLRRTPFITTPRRLIASGITSSPLRTRSLIATEGVLAERAKISSSLSGTMPAWPLAA